MNVSGFSGFQNNGNFGALLGANQMLFYCRYRQQRRDWNMVFIYATVGKDNDVFSVGSSAINCNVQLIQSPFQRCVLVIKQGNGNGMEARLIQRLDFHQVNSGQNRMINFQYAAVFCFVMQQVTVGADINGGVGNNTFP